MADVKNRKDKVVIAEFKVSMHCNACERAVAEAISRFKGVEKFSTDIVIDDKTAASSGEDLDSGDSTIEASLVFDDWGHSIVFTMFSDENPNACSIM